MHRMVTSYESACALKLFAEGPYLTRSEIATRCFELEFGLELGAEILEVLVTTVEDWISNLPRLSTL